MSLFLLLQLLGNILVSGTVVEDVDHGFKAIGDNHYNYYYNSYDLKNAASVKPGDRVIGVFLPSLEDESEFVGVYKW